MRTETETKSYKSAEDYHKDLEYRVSKNWYVIDQTQDGQRVAASRTLAKVALTGGIGLLLTGRSKKGGKITVTWGRERA
jgi:hypothetical protein